MEELDDVAHQRMVAIDREREPGHLVPERAPCGLADRQRVDQAQVEGFLDVVGQVMADEHRQNLRDGFAIRRAGGVPIDAHHPRPETRMATLIEQANLKPSP